jgi:hypothetical protein
MKLLQLFIAWWNAQSVMQRQRVNAHKAVPSDHFDKFGNYVFKDAKIGRLAGVAKATGATMSTVTFNTPVQVAVGSSNTSLSFVMSGVTSGQPIVLGILNYGKGPSSISPTFSDTFSVNYTYTQVTFAYNNSSFVSIYIATSGSGTSGTISVTGLPSFAGYGWGGSAVSCIGASTASGLSAVDVSTYSGKGGGSGATSTSITAGSMTPSYSTDGGFWVASAGATGNFTGPSSPFTYFSPDTTDGYAVYSAPPGAVNPSFSTGYVSYMSAAGVLILGVNSSAPSAPTLSGPANASYQDVSAGITLGPTTFNSTDGANQNAYSFHIKVSGGTYNYWNVGTNALQSTIVWNADSVVPGGTWSVTLPAGILTDGNVYNWSFASQESLSNLQGPFATDFTFTASSKGIPLSIFTLLRRH